MSKELMKRLVREETGSNAVEYVLILALISLVIMTAATTLGSTLRDLFLEAVRILTGNSPTS